VLADPSQRISGMVRIVDRVALARKREVLSRQRVPFGRCQTAASLVVAGEAVVWVARERVGIRVFVEPTLVGFRLNFLPLVTCGRAGAAFLVLEHAS
jgi:hypothetical protein